MGKFRHWAKELDRVDIGNNKKCNIPKKIVRVGGKAVQQLMYNEATEQTNNQNIISPYHAKPNKQAVTVFYYFCMMSKLIAECEEGEYGSNCEGRCGRCADGEACDKETGLCADGCKRGWQGDKCQQIGKSTLSILDLP